MSEKKELLPDMHRPSPNLYTLILWKCVSPKISSCFRFHTGCTNMQRVTLWFLRSSTQEQPEGDRPYFEVNPTPLPNSRYDVTQSETSHRTSPQACTRMANTHTQPQTLKSSWASFKRKGEENVCQVWTKKSLTSQRKKNVMRLCCCTSAQADGV